MWTFRFLLTDEPIQTQWIAGFRFTFFYLHAPDVSGSGSVPFHRHGKAIIPKAANLFEDLFLEPPHPTYFGNQRKIFLEIFIAYIFICIVYDSFRYQLNSAYF